MPKAAEAPFIVTLKPSSHLKQLVIAGHWLALASSIVSPLPIILKVVLMSVIAAHLANAVRNFNSELCTIKYTDASGWEIGVGLNFEKVDLLKSTVLTPFAIWLQVKKQTNGGFFAGNNKSILVMSDALGEDDYRQLIVKLKTSVGH